jgi:hypothetical protein
MGRAWAGLLGRLGHENCRALARRSGLARSAQPAQKPVGLTLSQSQVCDMLSGLWFGGLKH